MDTGPSDVTQIFGKNFLRKTHTFIEIFHKKFPIFSFREYGQTFRKLKIFQQFYYNFFTEGKKQNFLMKKPQQNCVFFLGNSYQILVSHPSDQYPCSSYVKRYVRHQNLFNKIKKCTLFSVLCISYQSFIFRHLQVNLYNMRFLH